MTFFLMSDNSPAARGVCNILDTLPPRSVFSDKKFFIMTGGLPYTAKQHKAMTKIIKDPSLIVIIIDIRPKEVPTYQLQLQRNYIYYLDGAISLQNITCYLNNILNDVEKEIKSNRKSIINKITVTEKKLLVGMLSNQSCKLYAEKYGLTLKSVSECRKNLIIRLGTCSPAALHAQLCVDGAVENNIVHATFSEKNNAGLKYYSRLFQDLITLEGIKVLRDL